MKPPLSAAPQLTILLATVGPERPETCVIPIVHALAARALDCDVELHFAGPAVRLLVEGIADTRYPTPQGEKSLGDFLREAALSGVQLHACSMAAAAWVAPGERLIPECSGMVGATVFIARTLDPDWRTLVF